MDSNVTNKYSQAFAGLDESTLSKLVTKLQQNKLSQKNEAYKFRRAISEFIRRAVSAWNMDGFVDLETLAYILTVEEFKLKQYSKLEDALRCIDPDYYTLNFSREFYKEKSNTITPYLNNYVTSGHLKIRLRRSKSQFPASTIDDFSLVVVSISDLKEWLSYAVRELPLIFSATKHFYPIWLKELLASQWITIPMLATTPKVVEVEVLNQNTSPKQPTVEWQKALVEQWLRIRASTVEYPSAEYILSWLKKNDDTNTFTDKGEKSKFYWRSPSDKQIKGRSFKTFENALVKLKEQGFLPDEITPTVT